VCKVKNYKPFANFDSDLHCLLNSSTNIVATLTQSHIKSDQIRATIKYLVQIRVILKRKQKQ